MKHVQKWLTAQGTKRDAERKLAELLHNLHRGEYVEPSKMTVGE
jgi:integrase